MTRMHMPSSGADAFVLRPIDSAFRDALIQAGYKMPAQHTEL